MPHKLNIKREKRAGAIEAKVEGRQQEEPQAVGVGLIFPGDYRRMQRRPGTETAAWTGSDITGRRKG
ncbi:hypothetical protein AAFF_G00394360 [Aldrovandia affinis]|uniref:Uncharacterized protein n=1 Tax=Aldrovandia affinis TaxID=143900 RepID=A0AAD7SDR6_9TELE|nr:hypothetical protein AAFF_G00394360 [Aldrovandia affinis]